MIAGGNYTLTNETMWQSEFVVIILGLKELGNAVVYHKQKKSKWAIASLVMGIFACACAIISITGIL